VHKPAAAVVAEATVAGAALVEATWGALAEAT
jgi:hypothetical protein